MAATLGTSKIELPMRPFHSEQLIKGHAGWQCILTVQIESGIFEVP